MDSPLTALVWEIWRRGRWSAWLAIGCVTLCALMNWVTPEWIGNSPAGQAVYGLSMVLSFLFLMGIFNYTEFSSTREWNGFPYRLFVLPVRAWQLVAVPMVLGLASTELLYLAWIKLVWNHPNDVARPEWFAVVLGGYMIVYQTTLWVMAGYRILRIVVLSLGGVSSLAVACLPFSGESQPSPWLSEERLIKVIIVTAVAAFVFAWVAAARQRWCWRWIRDIPISNMLMRAAIQCAC
jgi:hypothetical protein